MLRKEQRRHERRSTLRRRLLAGSTAAILALGMAAGGAAPAFAAPPSSGLPTPIVDAGGVTTYDQGGLVCSASSIGFQKPDALDSPNLDSDGSYAANWGTISWDESTRTVTWSIVDGWDVDVCVKGGTVLSLLDTSETAGTSYTHTYAGLSHLGFRINASTPGNDLDCVTATNFQGRALTNGDHINMDIVQGGTKFQINAQIDIRQSQDPASESGLVVRVNAPGGPYTLPLSNAERDSGVFSFSYSTYLSGQWTVEWVQFNSTYFNQSRNAGAFLVCGDLPTENLVTPTARMVDLECDTDGSYTLDDIEGVRWFIGDAEVQPGTYTVKTEQTIVVRAEADAPEFGLEPGATDEFTFVFTEPDDCVLPCLPASAVSYTYYNLSNATLANPANSGLITVTAREGYSAELCDPFWVVAAAWDFSSSTSIWPQTLRSTDPAGDHVEGFVDSVGTYFFHAPVDCGQGDVYASFDAMPYVGPELFGPSNPFTERFLHQMGFTGPNPTYFVTAPGCNLANPIAPTATPIVECGTYGSIDISDVANPYVGYTVYRGAADENGSVAGLDTVAIDDATEGVFTVVATALNGHIFAPGTERQWEFDLGEYYPCPVEVEPVAQKSTCETGGASILLPPVEGVVWFVNGVETPGSLTPIEVLEAGDYTVTVEIDSDADGGPYAFADGAVISWPFVFTEDELCELGQETFTNAAIGFIDPTCDLGQRLDPTKLVVADDTLAELQSYEEFTDGSYEVVFVTIDPDARFVEFETHAPGRTVSEGGTVLTFTGQLLGPDRGSECVTTVELTDPVTYTDSCIFGGSFTIYRVVGIAYTVFINDETPFVVEWADGERTRTYDVEEGDSVRVEPSPESDRYTISPDPAPFERTFAVYDDDCLPTLPLTEASVTFIPATCLDATNRVVLPEVEGVQWWVDGDQTVAGTWPLPAGEVVVEATPLQGYGFGLETETRWEFEFAAADEACDLSSLAETGASNALVGIGLAAVLITLAGFGVVIGRRFQQA